MDTFLLTWVAEGAAATMDADLGAIVDEALAAHADEWTSIGLPGFIVEGPVSAARALAAEACGRLEDAKRFRREALEEARRAGARRSSSGSSAWMARIERRPPRLQPGPPTLVTVRPRGRVLDGDVGRRRRSAQEQPRPRHAGASRRRSPVGRSPRSTSNRPRRSRSSTPAMRASCSTTPRAPRTDGASSNSRKSSRRQKPGTIQRASREPAPKRTPFARSCRRAVGLGGRARRAGGATERARVNVQRRIADAIHRIQEHDATLGRHLSRAVRTGAYLSYLPERAER